MNQLAKSHESDLGAVLHNWYRTSHMAHWANHSSYKRPTSVHRVSLDYKPAKPSIREISFTSDEEGVRKTTSRYCAAWEAADLWGPGYGPTADTGAVSFNVKTSDFTFSHDDSPVSRLRQFYLEHQWSVGGYHDSEWSIIIPARNLNRQSYRDISSLRNGKWITGVYGHQGES